MTPTQLREQVALIIEEQQRPADIKPLPLQVADRILALMEQLDGSEGQAEARDLDPADLDPQERADTIAGVRRGIADLRAGRVRPWKQIAAETRATHGFPG